MFFLYNFLWTVVSIPVFPVFVLYTLITKKKIQGLPHFFGILRGSEKKLLHPDRPTIWVHAISVGEVKAVSPVLDEIIHGGKKVNIVVSTTTQSGYDVAKNILSPQYLITYLPLDFFLIVKKMMKDIHPVLVIVTETGVWPNFAYYAKKINASLFLIHGRISQKSFVRYKKVKPVAVKLLNLFDRIYMQNDHGVNQLLDLGVLKHKVHTAGDSKFDTVKKVNKKVEERLKEKLNPTAGTITLIGGSTHEGEEEVLIDIFLSLKKKYNILLILAPRRLERIFEVEELIKKRSIFYELISKITRRQADICLLDTMGDLAALYLLGDVIFVGRSLFPPGGGHSLIEPVAYGKAVFHGPYVEYNKEISTKLKEEGIAIEVTDEADLEKKIELYIEDEKQKFEIEKKAEAFIKKNRGASKNLAETFYTYMEKA